MAPVTKPAPDEPVVVVEGNSFDDIGDRTSLWFDTNAKLVNIVLGILIVAALGWTVYRWINTGRQAKASSAYTAVLENLNTAAGEQDETKRRDALNTAITAAEAVIRDHPNSYLGRQAQLLLGNAHYELAAVQAGQNSTALTNARDAYQKYITFENKPQDEAAGYLALGNVLQDQLFISQDTKLVKDAEDAYKQAADQGRGTIIEAEAKLSLARMYQALENRQAEAEKLYKEVADVRKVPPAKEEKKASTTPADTEQTVTPEQINELKTLEKLSYGNVAQSALDRLPALQAQK